jgi:hypothetical protein
MRSRRVEPDLTLAASPLPTDAKGEVLVASWISTEIASSVTEEAKNVCSVRNPYILQELWIY